ncbi:MAG TPA: pyridoxal 5'-phosphate synthase glutaminase subunit PdxT [Candidatus Limnocylindria bacterium]|jgi:5'-phosphate synthase pdxT subunit|nr:pyridoxal 5'-phosphate synthase glutaminase subunit PdxT [Candidatus Limnocylindria bacterium]
MNAERRPRIGVLALQGAVREHVNAIREIGAEPVEIRLPRDLVDLDALILPGGESTTMRKLLDAYNLREPIAAMARNGTPMLGTCAGMILLSTRIADGDEPVFGLLDIEVTRNGYGRQLDSFETELETPSLGNQPMHAVFIRAPMVTSVGDAAEVLATDPDGRPVAVRQGRVLATSFHPELTGDRRMHRLLLTMVEEDARRPA